MRFAVSLAIFTMLSANALASEALLFVSPLRVELKPAQTTEVLTVTNKSSQTQRYRVQALDQAMNANGVTEQVDGFPYSAKRMLRFMPKHITLEPGQRQVVRVMASRPADLPDGDYHTHILFEQEAPTEDPKTKKEQSEGKGPRFSLGSIYSIAVPVVVQKGNITSSVTFNSISVLPVGPENKTPAIKASFTRGGNAEAHAYLTVKSNKDTDLISPRMVRLYHEVTNATLTLPLKDAAATYHGPASIRLTAGPETDAAVISASTITVP